MGFFQDSSDVLGIFQDLLSWPGILQCFSENCLGSFFGSSGIFQLFFGSFFWESLGSFNESSIILGILFGSPEILQRLFGSWNIQGSLNEPSTTLGIFFGSPWDPSRKSEDPMDGSWDLVRMSRDPLIIFGILLEFPRIL